jgi:hypothetical protein
MFIWKETKLRCNPYAPYIDEQGTQYPQVPRELLEEIPDPARGNDEIEYTQEIDEAPYIVITPKPQEQLDQQRKSKALAELTALEQANLMPRVTREFLIQSFILTAAGQGITKEQLLDSNDPHYAPGFKKMWDFNLKTIELRAKL